MNYAGYDNFVSVIWEQGPFCSIGASRGQGEGTIIKAKKSIL